jgi:hypothetical protein
LGSQKGRYMSKLPFEGIDHIDLVPTERKDMPDTNTQEKSDERGRNQDDKKIQGAKLAGFLRRKLHSPVAIIITIGLISTFCSLLVYFFLG